MVKLAKTAGFCFGVDRAVNLVYDLVNKGERVCTLGPIIHNSQLVEDLEGKGVKIIDDISQCPEGYTVVIRTHGVEKQVIDNAQLNNVDFINATCPFVLKIHRLVEKHSSEGSHIIIIGNPDHPEVEGIRGWVIGEAVTIINSAEDAQKFSLKSDKKVCIVSQTTFNYNKFQELVEIIMKKGYDICVLNTICNATEERQTEAREISMKSEAMIVIGDKNSSNTQKLFEICKKECENTYYIQTSKGMDYNKLKSINNVGITAGASTPNNIIEEVSKNVRNEL